MLLSKKYIFYKFFSRFMALILFDLWIFCPGLQIATDTGANVTNIFSLAIKNSCWVATLATRFLSTSFPGFSPTRPTEQEGERPWKTLVTCLPKSGRVQANDLGEGQVSVRFVSTECSQVSAAMKLCTWPDLERQNKIMHKILWQRKRNFLQNIWMLIRCSSAMLSFGTCNGNRRGFTVCAVKNNLGILVVVFIPKRIRFELPFLCCGGHFRK